VVVADTHSPPQRVDESLIRRFGEAEMLIHAGDICSKDVLALLHSHFPTMAVWGNNDPHDLRSAIPERLRLDLAGVRIEVIHGHQRRTAVETARFVAREMEHGIVIFGHSHQAFCARERDVILFNPGSPTAPRFSKRRTFGILTLGDTIEAEIFDLA
jgi:putative phosphoesterase